MRFVSYARVSTEQQAGKQISIPAQQVENRDYALKNGLLIREFADEGVSGETLQRPALQALIALAKEGAQAAGGALLDKKTVVRNGLFDVVVVWKLDRLSRPNVDDDLDFLLLRRELRACAVAIHSVTETWVAGHDEMSQFMGYLGRGQSKVEAIKRMERFRLGRKGVIERDGRSVWAVPYGYEWLDTLSSTSADRRKGRQWQIAEPQGSLVKLIYREYLAGQSVNSIARLLNSQGVAAPSQIGHGALRGGCIQHGLKGWTTDGIRRILTSRVYAGFLQFEGAWIDVRGKPQAHEPLIADEDWHLVQAIRQGRGKWRAAASPALFAGGLLRCPLCAARGVDTAMVVMRQYQNRRLATTGEIKRYEFVAYRCSERHGAQRRMRLGAEAADSCPGYGIGELKALRLLLVYLRRRAAMVSRGDQDSVRQSLSPRPARASTSESLAEGVRRQLAQIPAMEANYQDQQAMGLMTLPQLAERLKALQERRAMLLARQEEIKEDKPAESIPALDAARLLRILEAGGDALPKRDALNLLFAKIIPGLDRKSLTLFVK